MKRPEDVPRARLAPATARLREAQRQGEALLREPHRAFDAACLEAHEAGYSLAAIGRVIRERPELVGRRVELARALRQAGRAPAPVPLPSAGRVRFRRSSAVHQRWWHGDRYGDRTLCGRRVTPGAEVAGEADVTCVGCQGPAPGPVVFSVRMAPQHMAALMSPAPEVDAARAEVRFEQARKGRGAV